METMTDLQLGAYGAQLTGLKVYNFTLIDTGQISSTGSTGGGPTAAAGDRVYTLGGFTSQEIPFALIGATGAFGFHSATSPGQMIGIPRFNATSTGVNQLVVSWARAGAATSTSGATPAMGGTGTGPISTGMAVSLFTVTLYAPAVTTST